MIDVEDTSAIRILTLNRPEKANSLTKDMLLGLEDAVRSVPVGTKALILTGAGKVFSAGADLDAAKAGLTTDPIWEAVSAAVAAFPGLSVAALNGTLAGGAFGLALASDIRISVAGANFFYPVMKLGFLPQPSDPPRLKALVGAARAKCILMAGQKINASTALNWGLIDMIVEPPHLLDEAKTLCGSVQAADDAHISAIKTMIG
ncbi:MAG: enoyl-CoA hydratase/isomerase family protein [Pseudomonadota bacterium]